MDNSKALILIRVDASAAMGSGHLMRCLTLAETLRQGGADVVFACRELPGHAIPVVETKGFPVLRLRQPETPSVAVSEDGAYAEWLGVPWQRDAAETIAAMGRLRPRWLIVDHYALDRRWEQKLRPKVGKIMAIDDLADRPHDCDLLLDQNLYPEMATRYDGLVPDSCHKLLGPKFALLRPEFAAARGDLRRRDGEVRRVLVFFGAVDPGNETEKALRALSLAGIGAGKLHVDVVVGGGNPHKERVEAFCAAHDGFHYRHQVDNMARLMAAADLAVGAGGTATWERCAVGLPSLVCAVADNQKELARTGALNGLLFYLGEAPAVSSERLSEAVRFCAGSPETLRFYGANCLETVDAKGARRVSNLLFPPEIAIRRASLEDCDAIYQWRNAEETRRYIFDAGAIALETHRAWYRATLANPDRVLLIGEVDGQPVGVLRYDFSGREALISVYLVPGGQGQGIGSQLIRCGSHWLRAHRPGTRVVNAEVFKANIASLRAFEAAGYEEHHRIFQEAL